MLYSLNITKHLHRLAVRKAPQVARPMSDVGRRAYGLVSAGAGEMWKLVCMVRVDDEAGDGGENSESLGEESSYVRLLFHLAPDHYRSRCPPFPLAFPPSRPSIPLSCFSRLTTLPPTLSPIAASLLRPAD